LPGGSPKNTGHWHGAQTIELFTYVFSGITINSILDKEPIYRTVRLNTGHLATLHMNHCTNSEINLMNCENSSWHCQDVGNVTAVPGSQSSKVLWWVMRGRETFMWRDKARSHCLPCYCWQGMQQNGSNDLSV